MMRKTVIFLAALAAALWAPAAGAAPTVSYGFCPSECEQGEMTAIGSGANSFIEGAIRIDPAVDPLVGKLKGRRVLGVRCYLRADYKQKSKGFSCVKLFSGSLDNTPVTQTVNFSAGWNEVMFDSPVEIGSEPLFVGYQVFETQGEPYPLAAWRQASIPGVCYINAGRKGWEERSDHGVLMIEAIVDGDVASLSGHVVASPFDQPLVVAPASPFECKVYLHNQTATEISEIECTAFDAEGNATGSVIPELSEPLPPYGSATVTARFIAPSAEGAEVPLYVRATAVDGIDAPDCMTSEITLYVSSDVFHRIPLVEEFTGLRCNNCPFMFYYLDMALDAFAAPHVYVAHHAGFIDDVLTQPCDGSLLYLFGQRNTFNPAVMYDRRVLQGTDAPAMGAGTEASTAPYDSRLAEVMLYPALAKVEVESEVTASSASCRVHGKISKAALDFKDNLWLTVYLLEDEIPAEGNYVQWGLDDAPEDAPDDLLDRFRHRGVIRHCYTTGLNGDPLAVDAEGNFDVAFSDAKIDPSWKWRDCEAVAFVHKVNPDNLSDNFVLNAGAQRFNDYAALPPVVAPAGDGMEVRIGPDGRISLSDSSADVSVYTVSGLRCNPASALSPGVYVVRWQRSDGTTGARKMLVR